MTVFSNVVLKRQGVLAAVGTELFSVYMLLKTYSHVSRVPSKNVEQDFNHSMCIQPCASTLVIGFIQIAACFIFQHISASILCLSSSLLSVLMVASPSIICICMASYIFYTSSQIIFL